MSEYDNELRGALFKNKNMREGKKDPEYKGSITVFGVEFWQSAWINTAKSGEKYMGQNLQPKDAEMYEAIKAALAKVVAKADAAPAQAPAKPGTDAEFDDDIPF